MSENETPKTDEARPAVASTDWLAGRRYALLAGPTYYPPPGFTAFIEAYDDVEAATVEGRKRAEDMYGWWQVVDMRTGTIVAGEGEGHTGLMGKFPAGPANSDSPEPNS